MARSKRKNSAVKRWEELGEEVHRTVPHLYAVLGEEDEFIELRAKARLDGTTLVILKRYGSDGTPMVCFGSGYGVFGALVAVDSTIQSGNWKVDKPWVPGE